MAGVHFLMTDSEPIQSVVTSRRNADLIAAVAEVWIDSDDVVLDMTYGKGNFWTVYRPDNLIVHDLALDGVDFAALPELDESVDVVVFDPPYIAPGAKDGKRDTTGVPEFFARYGLANAPRNATELEAMFRSGIIEGFRVLRPRGRLLVKCMDFVHNSGRGGNGMVPSHYNVIRDALAVGFQFADEFVHHSGLGPQPTERLGTRRLQHHSRRSHSFLTVFGKAPHGPRKKR